MENNNNKEDNKTCMEHHTDETGTIYRDQKRHTRYYFRRAKNVDNNMNGYDGVLPEERNYTPDEIDFTTTSDEEEAWEVRHRTTPWNPDLDFSSSTDEEEANQEETQEN